MKTGDHKAAFSYFQKAAARGYSKAQYNEGLCHEYGRGTSRDLSKVLHLLLSCPQTHPLCCKAQSDLQNEQWAGLGESSFSLPAVRETCLKSF